jgi:hypothetical protein
MIALDYSSVISQTSVDVEKSKKKINIFFALKTMLSFVWSLFSVKPDAIEKTFTYQLIMTKWLLADMQIKLDAVENQDFNTLINLINRLINLNVEVQAKIEKHISKEENQQLTKVNLEIQETIANLYSCLRLLKKANKRNPIQTTELAKSAALRSANTLKTIYAN